MPAWHDIGHRDEVCAGKGRPVVRDQTDGTRSRATWGLGDVPPSFRCDIDRILFTGGTSTQSSYVVGVGVDARDPIDGDLREFLSGCSVIVNRILDENFVSSTPLCQCSGKLIGAGDRPRTG